MMYIDFQEKAADLLVDVPESFHKAFISLSIDTTDSAKVDYDIVLSRLEEIIYAMRPAIEHYSSIH